MLKYGLGNGTHYDGIKRPFGNTAPLLNLRPPRYSSSNVTNLMEKIKKGSQKFINNSSMTRWKKTLQDEYFDPESIRNCFKMIHWKEFTA